VVSQKKSKCLSKRLVSFVGPSGSGKDTLMVQVRDLLLACDINAHIVKRVITREKDNTENFTPVSNEEFDYSVNSKLFCFHWEIYGNKYGILKEEIDPYLDTGYIVFVNLSRAILHDFKKKYPYAKIVVIDISKRLAEERIKIRKRDTGKNLEARLDRLSEKIDMPLPDIYIKNEGKMNVCLSLLLEVLKSLA
jgi:ribose 1,5-bisphosphokinase